MHRQQLGMTLIELLVVVVITAILAAVALPAFSTMMSKRRIEGVANELSADLQFARTQAVADNTNVTLATTSTTSYTVTGNQVYKRVSLPSGVTVTHPVTVPFTALRGCTASACNASELALTVESTSTSVTEKLKVIVNNMGRVQMCTPSGSFSGYTTCPSS